METATREPEVLTDSQPAPTLAALLGLLEKFPAYVGDEPHAVDLGADDAFCEWHSEVVEGVKALIERRGEA